MNKRKILILFTGGTIASIETENGMVPMLYAEQIVSLLPKLPEHIELEVTQLFNIDSTDMTYRHWIQIAHKIEEQYEVYDGFVICHGTDTMAYTAAALSYLIQNSPKPIVLTGSQKTIQTEISDAKKNLMDSILYAADENSSDVCVVFYGKVIAGTRAKKVKSFSYDAFASINYPAIAAFQNNSRIIRYVAEKSVGPVRFYHQMNPKVFALKLTPGITSAVLETLFMQYDCIIIESFGVGGIPESIIHDLRRLMEDYQGCGKFIVMTTQVTYEGSDIATYEVGYRISQQFPFLETHDMTFEAAFTKMMWALAQEDTSFEHIKKLFLTDVNHDILV